MPRRIVAERGTPAELVLDNGPELAGKALDQWADEREVRLRFIEPGELSQNGFVESFDGRLRDERLKQHWFLDLADAWRIVGAKHEDYNRGNPRSV